MSLQEHSVFTHAKYPLGDERIQSVSSADRQKERRIHHARTLLEGRLDVNPNTAMRCDFEAAPIDQKVLPKVAHDRTDELRIEFEGMDSPQVLRENRISKVRIRKTFGQRSVDISRSIREALSVIESGEIPHPSQREDTSSHLTETQLGTADLFERIHASLHSPQHTQNEGVRDIRKVNKSVFVDAVLGEKAAADVVPVFATHVCTKSTLVDPVSPVAVSIDDAACDALLGGGLLCGVLHEISGVFTGRDPRWQRDQVIGHHVGSDSQKMKSRATPCRDFQKEHFSRTETESVVSSNHHVSDWIVPFGSIMHVVRRAAAHEKLQGRPIIWIGDRVHPDPSTLVSVCEQSNTESVGIDFFLLECSMYVADASPEILSKRTSGKSRRVIHAPMNPSQARAWCAEQALRSAAASIMILDGTDFDFSTWRRLQLAASECDIAVLILVICPPEKDDGRNVRRHPAATRWSVDAAGGVDPHDALALHTDHEHRSPRHISESDVSHVFRWRMTLRAVRGRAMHAVATAKRNQCAKHESFMSCSGGNDWMTALADGKIGVEVTQPRAVYGTATWSKLLRMASSNASCAENAEIFQSSCARSA